jgi:hypothetical protein
VNWEIPGSDREVSFEVVNGDLTEELMGQMFKNLVFLVGSWEDDDGWEVHKIDGSDKWYATDQGRWNRFEWSGEWVPSMNDEGMTKF